MRYFRLFLTIVAPLALALLIYQSWDEIVKSFSYVFGGQVDGQDLPGLPVSSLLVLLLQVPLQFVAIGAVAHFYYNYFAQAGLLARARLKDMYQTALELYFINNAFPSGGVSGFSYLGLRLRPLGIKTASSMVAQSLRFSLTLIGYLPILALGIFFLTIDDQINNWFVLVAAGCFFGIILLCLLVWYLISDSQRTKNLIRFLPQLIKRLSQRWPVLRSDKVSRGLDRIDRVFIEIHIDYIKLKQNPKQFVYGTGYMTLFSLFDVLTIYLIYAAFFPVFGEMANPGAIVLAYMAANTAGLLVILPGGIGVYEALMIGTIVATGVTSELVIVTALLYRAFKLLVLVPVGFLFYQAAVKRKLKVPKTLEADD